MNDLSIALVGWVVCGIAAYVIAQSRKAERPWLWLAIGLLFGPFGVLLAAAVAYGPETKPR